MVHTDDGAELRTRRWGRPRSDAPTIVLSHCWTGRQSMWSPVAKRLADAGWCVVTYDHRGHGRSTTGQAEPTVARLVADLETVIEALAPGPVVVVGHSMGGATVLEMVLNKIMGDRIAGLVLISTSARFAPPLMRPVLARLVGLITTTTGSLLISSRAGRILIRPTLGRRAEAGAVAATIDSLRDTDPTIVADQYRHLLDHDRTAHLPTITVPTRVLVGRLDTLTPVTHARRLARSIPDAQLTIEPGAGHMLPLERPDLVADQIDQLASETVGQPSTVC